MRITKFSALTKFILTIGRWLARQSSHGPARKRAGNGVDSGTKSSWRPVASLGAPARRSRYGEVVTDSAKAKKGSVFVALKGERLDGHRFVGDAVRRGAACVITHRALPRSAVGAATVVRVADTLRALGGLAHFRREQLAPKVLAITGSNGKTTTKEMLAAILEEASLDGQALRGKVLKTEGNFNNLVGLAIDALAPTRTGQSRGGRAWHQSSRRDSALGRDRRRRFGDYHLSGGGTSRRIAQLGRRGAGKRRDLPKLARRRRHRG